MTLCPIALVVGCQGCPLFKVCPLKSVIGDQPKIKRKTASKKKSEKFSYF